MFRKDMVERGKQYKNVTNVPSLGYSLQTTRTIFKPLFSKTAPKKNAPVCIGSSSDQHIYIQF